MKTIYTITLLFISTLQLSAQGLTLFNDNYIHEIRFETVDTLIFITTENYQSVKMIFDGNTVNNVGLKEKGNISASHANNKVPFKIKTNEYVSGQEFDGIREFTLNNSFQDPSMMREKMTYDISRSMGLYGLRTAYAKVYMDNVYWGVYTIVEGKDEMYKHVFNNKDGDAIESTDYGNMCYYGAAQSDYVHPAVNYRYIIDNGDVTTAWSRFINMLDKANNTPNATYTTTVSNYLNIEDFVRYQALNVYLLNFDSYVGFIGNQLYYFDETVNIWQVIPWDFNASFGLWNTNNFTPTTYPLMPSAITNGCIGSFIDTDPTLKSNYLSAICDFVSTYADTINVNAAIDNWRTQIKAAVYTDWRKEFTNTEFDNGTSYGYYLHNGETVPAMKTFAKDRFETISTALATINYACATTSTTRLNTTQSISIFPNPTTHSITLKWKKIIENTPISYQIFDISGQLVQTGIFNNDRINIKGLEAGIYILKCVDRQGNLGIGKIIKLRK